MRSLLPSDFSLERYGISLRLAREDDSEFIVQLRTDERLGRYIHATPADIEQQKAWRRSYAQREEAGLEYYFIFEKPLGKPWGTYRIYDIGKDSYVIGSWIFKDGAPRGMSVLADILISELAYAMMPDRIMFYDVEAGNTSVWQYHMRMGAELICERDSTKYFKQEKDAFVSGRRRMLRALKPIGYESALDCLPTLEELLSPHENGYLP